MIDTTPNTDPFRIVIAGGGVAALETALALNDLATDLVSLTLLAPDPDFVYRPMTVREPFAYGRARRYPIAAIAADAGAELVADRLSWIDPEHQSIHTDAGDELVYDALVLALGARAVERYAHALTIDDRRLDDLLHGLVQDVESNYVRRLAFVVPARMAWPLPIYELALMTARRAYDMNTELAVTVVTPEDAPLAIFGLGASHGVSQLLAEAGIATVTSAYVQVPNSRHLVVMPGDRHFEVDRIVALPELYGPAVRGLDVGEHGFIDVDPYCRVRDIKYVYAAGDATAFPVKHGGIAAQQADVAATSIAALAGAPVEPKRFHPVIHGMLLTGGAPRYLTARITGGHGFSSEITDTPTWTPATKIAAKYLAPYLDQLDRAAVAS
jgi:sulfide:quinone oxidoreductase